MQDIDRFLEPTAHFVPPTKPVEELVREGQLLAEKFQEVTSRDVLRWPVTYKLVHKLGSGGQGVVYLADRSGSFGASFRLALKFFRPTGYPSIEVYREEMVRLSRLAMKLAALQHDQLLDVINVVEFENILALVMEWVDGYDLRFLLTPHALSQVRASVDEDRWEHVNDVVVTRSGPQVRLKPGVAIAILRDCLSGLAALHREGLVHADLKPANIMLKRTGSCKLIDFGSAFALDELPLRPTWTPRYAAVEVLEGQPHTPVSDLASLGYVLVEMLSGTYPFIEASDGPELVTAKFDLNERLEDVLPEDVSRNEALVEMISRLIAPDPGERFSTAEEADLSESGALSIQRQLVKGDLDSDYANEIRLWLQELE